MALIYLGYKALTKKKGEKDEDAEETPDIRHDIPKDPNEKKKKVSSKFEAWITNQFWKINP